MKKMICLALALMLFASAAAAPQLSDKLFAAAKRAADCIARRDCDSLADLPFSGPAPDAAEWASFAANYSYSGHAQQDYAVGYWKKGRWQIAVPMEIPDDDSVEALILTSEDGSSFSGYLYADWGKVCREYAGSDHVVWNSEYVTSAPRVFAD